MTISLFGITVQGLFLLLVACIETSNGQATSPAMLVIVRKVGDKQKIFIKISEELLTNKR